MSAPCNFVLTVRNSLSRGAWLKTLVIAPRPPGDLINVAEFVPFDWSVQTWKRYCGVLVWVTSVVGGSVADSDADADAGADAGAGAGADSGVDGALGGSYTDAAGADVDSITLSISVAVLDLGTLKLKCRER